MGDNNSNRRLRDFQIVQPTVYLPLQLPRKGDTTHFQEPLFKIFNI